MRSCEDIVIDNLDLLDRCLIYQTRGFKQYVDDLRQEIILQMLELDIEKLNKIADEGRVNCYLTKIIWNSLHSPTSPFYRKFIAPQRRNRSIENFDFIDEEA